MKWLYNSTHWFDVAWNCLSKLSARYLEIVCNCALCLNKLHETVRYEVLWNNALCLGKLPAHKVVWNHGSRLSKSSLHYGLRLYKFAPHVEAWSLLWFKVVLYHRSCLSTSSLHYGSRLYESALHVQAWSLHYGLKVAWNHASCLSKLSALWFKIAPHVSPFHTTQWFSSHFNCFF